MTEGNATVALTLLRYLECRHWRRFRDRRHLERWQESRVRRHLVFLRAHSPYFMRVLSRHAWPDLPLMDKQLMMKHFDELNTRNIRKADAFALAIAAESSRDFSATLGDITVGLSSGTSGSRGLFLVSPRERAEWAGEILAKLLPRHLLNGRHRLALFLRSNSNLYETTRSSRVQFDYFDLLDSFPRHVERLNEVQPTVVVAPPSMWRLLADESYAHRLDIAPERIVSAAEVLEPQDRAHIEHAFGQVLHQVYQATEGFLGSTCSHGTLHLNEDCLVVEREALPGDATRFLPIITDFRRRTQPIVRYRLDDILTPRVEPCPCGSPFAAIERIEGRSDDMFEFPRTDGQAIVGRIFPDFVRNSIITAAEGILEYRARQVGECEVIIELRSSGGADRDAIKRAVERNIHALCDKLRLVRPRLEFVGYDPPAGAAKLRRVTNERGARRRS